MHVTRSPFRVVSQLEKMYTEDDEDSSTQMEEERARMRNHVMAEVRSAGVWSGHVTQPRGRRSAR